MMSRRWQPTPRELAFIAAMVALDLTYGVVVKHLLAATGAMHLIRIDMVVPIALFVLTRHHIDRFGSLTLYQTSWGLLATLLLPNAIVPGPLKLVPLVLQGLTMDTAFSATRRLGRARPYLAVVLGGLVSHTLSFAFRVWVLGLPWAKGTQGLFWVEQLSLACVGAAGVMVARLVMRRLRHAI